MPRGRRPSHCTRERPLGTATRYTTCASADISNRASLMSLVLLVDDDAENRCALKMAFESHGHHVLVAKNGRDALRKASSSPPELVVTDLQMPQMGGEELCYQLKRRSAFAAIPVILLSAVREPAYAVRCWAAYLRKPAVIGRLLNMAEALIAARGAYGRASEYDGASRRQGIDSRCWP
ncbi:response regulator [Paraburkholderia caledonica]|uniref:response regulator n=2 Tax=Paraburkholderia caledonica TaxID=134536 RepID=UPI003C94CC63